MVDFFLMSNLSPKRTGLPFVVWISEKDTSRHDIRLKVAQGAKVKPGEMITVALRPEVRVIGSGRLSGKDMALLKKWVALNFDTLLGYWNRDIEYTEDAIARLKSV